MSSNGGGAWACKVYGRVSRRSLVGFVILAGLAVQLSPTRSWWAVGDRKLQKHAEGLRVAICFFGLTRSLQWTLPSIKNRLIDVLRDHELTVDVFVHTFELEKVNNVRAGEENILYGSHREDFRLLNATRSMVTNQDELDVEWPDPMARAKWRWSYPPDWAPDVVRNIFRVYWSMAASWGLMAQHAKDAGVAYDAVVLARPDVWFHADIDLPTKLFRRKFFQRRQFPLPERTVYVPTQEIDRNGERINDRFGYGSVPAMEVLMNRNDTFFDPKAASYGTHDSEMLLGHHLKTNNITVQHECTHGKDPMACKMIELGFRIVPVPEDEVS